MVTKKKFIQGTRVRVIFHDKNNEKIVPVGATGTVFENSDNPVIYVVMDDEKLNVHNTNAFNGNSPKAAILFAAELEKESTPDDLEQTKQKILRYSDYWGGDISDVETIKNAKTKHELNDIIYDHEAKLESQLAEAISHLSKFKRSLTFLKD